MAWKPWYERFAELDSVEERDQFLKGVFAAPKPPSGTQVAGTVLTALLAGWGVNKVITSAKKRK